VGLEDANEDGPPADFVSDSVDFTLADRTIPSALGLGFCLGSLFGRGASGRR
jgi:hypothetical protein